jgi:guanidinopropionase
MFGSFNHYNNISPSNLCRIADVGDVPVQHRYNLDQGIHDIEKYYHTVMNAGIKPLTAGGDHSITYPILKAVGRDAPVGLVHVDAHCDTDGWMGNSKFYYGAPFRNAVLEGVLDHERTIQIGIRGPSEPAWEFSHESGMTVIHVEIIPNRIGLELRALPEKIVMVGDGRKTGFGDDLGDGQAEGDI